MIRFELSPMPLSEPRINESASHIHRSRLRLSISFTSRAPLSAAASYCTTFCRLSQPLVRTRFRDRSRNSLEVRRRTSLQRFDLRAGVTADSCIVTGPRSGFKGGWQDSFEPLSSPFGAPPSLANRASSPTGGASTTARTPRGSGTPFHRGQNAGAAVRRPRRSAPTRTRT